MDRKSTIVDNLLISLIDSWNNENPKSKLSSELLCSIHLHFGHAYTVGYEDAFRIVKNELDKYEYSNKMSYVLMRQIIDPRTYEL